MLSSLGCYETVMPIVCTQSCWAQWPERQISLNVSNGCFSDLVFQATLIDSKKTPKHLHVKKQL